MMYTEGSFYLCFVCFVVVGLVPIFFTYGFIRTYICLMIHSCFIIFPFICVFGFSLRFVINYQFPNITGGFVIVCFKWFNIESNIVLQKVFLVGIVFSVFVQLESRLNTKTGLHHHHPPQTFPSEGVTAGF